VRSPCRWLLQLRRLESSLFGDSTCTAPRAVQFYNASEVVTARWPDPGTSSVDLGLSPGRGSSGSARSGSGFPRPGGAPGPVSCPASEWPFRSARDRPRPETSANAPARRRGVALAADDLTAELVDDASDLVDGAFRDAEATEHLALGYASDRSERDASDGTRRDIRQSGQTPGPRVSAASAVKLAPDDDHRRHPPSPSSGGVVRVARYHFAGFPRTGRASRCARTGSRIVFCAQCVAISRCLE